MNSRVESHWRRARRTTLLVLLMVTTVWAGAEDTPRVAPQKNFSTIFSEVEWVTRAFERATTAANDENWSSAVRLLQEVVDARSRANEPAKGKSLEDQSAPYVVPVRGTTVFEGAWIVAHHQRVRWGKPAVDACVAEFGHTAGEMFDRALRLDDDDLLAEVALRFLTLPVGRRAALHLADRALEQGRRDEALEWVELLADLEAVSTEPKEDLAPFAQARLQRHADALAASALQRPQVLKVLEARAVAASAPEGPFEPFPSQTVAGEGYSRSWLSTGGHATRAARAEKRPATLTLKWYHHPEHGLGPVDRVEPRDDGLSAPSTWLPPRAICVASRAIASDGEFLTVYDLDSGRALERVRFQFARSLETDTDEDRRERFGMLEGHCLTAAPLPVALRSPGRGDEWLILAAVPDGRMWHIGERAKLEERREDHIEAYRFDGKSLTFLWVAGNTSKSPGAVRVPDRPSVILPGQDRPATNKNPDIRMYGAPILYRGRVWVAGTRPALGNTDQLESWIYALSPTTGAIELRTHLGTGTPMRAGRHDEVIPTSPAARHGRVVVGTAIGVLAAVSARDGRVLWAYRYPRNVAGDKARRIVGTESERGGRTSSFQNEPPILTADLCIATPTDGRHVLVTTTHPIGRERMLRCHEIERHERFGPHAAEYVAGAYRDPDHGAWRMVVVGIGGDTEPPGPMVLAVDPLTEARLWYEPSPTGRGSLPFGRGFIGEDHAYVPTRYGIAVYNLADGNVAALIDRSAIPKDMRERAPAVPYGNLIPTPNGGVLSVSATTVAYWAPTTNPTNDD